MHNYLLCICLKCPIVFSFKQPCNVWDILGIFIKTMSLKENMFSGAMFLWYLMILWWSRHIYFSNRSGCVVSFFLNVPLSIFLKASLVVNVASYCQHTDKNYIALQELHREFGPSHFTVLAFPCNQFGESEPSSSQEIESFAKGNYGVTFPIFHKIKILGSEAEPAFKFLVGKYLLFASFMLHFNCIIIVLKASG